MTVKNETIYATMQAPLPPPAASTGADGASASGVLEVMVKSSTKKSISVIVCGVWFDRCDGTVLVLEGSSTLPFYTS